MGGSLLIFESGPEAGREVRCHARQGEMVAWLSEDLVEGRRGLAVRQRAVYGTMFGRQINTAAKERC